MGGPYLIKPERKCKKVSFYLQKYECTFSLYDDVMLYIK